MRTRFNLIRGVAQAPEAFATLEALAARVHRLRGERPLQLSPCALSRVDQPNGPGVAIRYEDELGGVLGYAFFPETRAYVWPADRAALSAELRRQKPEMLSQVRLEELEGEPSGREAPKGRPAGARRVA